MPALIVCNVIERVYTWAYNTRSEGEDTYLVQKTMWEARELRKRIDNYLSI
jgi:hypothetical protein